ncbi:MAG: PrgI family protein, partial [Firmicutes bacterium]|nr:PrgI family protein [Bacillota bacterium]
ETDPNCRMLQEDYLHLIDRIGSKEATTRRFFISFEYESMGRRSGGEEDDAIASLQVAARTAMNYLKQCGNEVVTPENEDEFTVDVLYNILCRQSSADIPLAQRVQNVVSDYLAAGKDTENIPSAEFFAPKQIDCTHGKYICVDGLYHSYLMIPSFGYKSQVTAGWLSLIVNAGDGIDMDLFLSKQPKERMVQKLGQQIRINRSKIKETSDTNTDFDDLDSAIRSGYFLKNGLANNEDFYYMNLLITITAETPEDLEWREREMRKLLLSQDLNIVTCSFREEQAFLSALPLVSMEKHLYERSKRNVLTSGAASCYPFTAYELCDDNGIMLGVNKFNNSLTIVDIFNSRNYKNANISIMGTSGAGKTFTMQLMGLRMRRKGIQVFVIAPLKGHEFHRACTNIGGEFISISPASNTCINVMEIRKVDKSVDELLDGGGVERSELASKIQQLHIFFSLLIPDITHEERQLLDEALIRTYAAKGITHDNDSLTDPDHPDKYKEMPILGDLYDVLIASQETKRLANILNRLVHGSAQTFSRQTNVDLDNKYTVLDISELTGDLLTVGMFVALDFVWDKAKENRAVEKAIFIDECWKLIGAGSNRLAAEYVLEIFKIIRGYGGSAVCATQDINDFFALEDGKYGKGIINNCKTKIVLNLEDDEAQRVQSIMRLSEAEVMEITHFERGNGLISTNNNNVTVEFKCSDLEKSLITTDRRELQELIEQKRT